LVCQGGAVRGGGCEGLHETVKLRCPDRFRVGEAEVRSCRNRQERLINLTLALRARNALLSIGPAAGSLRRSQASAALLRNESFDRLARRLPSRAPTSIPRQVAQTARAVFSPNLTTRVRISRSKSDQAISPIRTCVTRRVLTPVQSSCSRQALQVAHRQPLCPAIHACPPRWTFAWPEHVPVLRDFASTLHREGWWAAWASYKLLTMHHQRGGGDTRSTRPYADRIHYSICSPIASKWALRNMVGTSGVSGQLRKRKMHRGQTVAEKTRTRVSIAPKRRGIAETLKALPAKRDMFVIAAAYARLTGFARMRAGFSK
jgi:hypothetical protein